MFTLTGKSSVLTSIELFNCTFGDDNRALTDFEMYYTLVNVNSINNKFYYDNEEIVILERSYELCSTWNFSREGQEGWRVPTGDLC